MATSAKNPSAPPASPPPSGAPVANEFVPRPLPRDAQASVDRVATEMGGPYQAPEATAGAVGYTHFDGPGSEDTHVVVLMPKGDMARLPSQMLVRIKSLGDDRKVERTFLGVVTAGPFAEPDGLRSESPLVVMTTLQGQVFLPNYHGRAHVQLLGEEANGQLVPPRHRPKPNSSVHPLDAAETARALNLAGDLRLGLLVGQETIPVLIPTTEKGVLPRHTGIIGTTGGGKSNTVAVKIGHLQEAGAASILIDVEGEYTEIDTPTQHPKLLAALKTRGLAPAGVKGVTVYHLVGRESSREAPGGAVQPFCLRFDEISPYTVADLLELNEAQRDRFFVAYEATQVVLKEMGISPANDEEKQALLTRDDLDIGYPKMTLRQLLDVAQTIHDKVSKSEDETKHFDPAFKDDPRAKAIIVSKAEYAAQKKTDNRQSWRALLGKLYQINRLKVFDSRAKGVKPLDYAELIRPGHVSVIDLSDTDSTIMNNLVIASILRGVQAVQEDAVDAARRRGARPTLVDVFIEEAHEFLSKERIAQMPSVFQQVARIAKRGRKRWLALTFITQLPQHLPDEVLGLLNNFVLHKIGDANVIARLRRSISGPDDAQWNMVPGLAQGQALVSYVSMTRPLLVSIDPAGAHVRLTD